jgi:cytosine/adenosine deaminase-related metal-dependent hydrolase
MSSFCIDGATLLTANGAAQRALYMRGEVFAVSGAVDGSVQLADHVILPSLINAHDHLHLNNVPPLPQTQFFANSYEWIDAMPAHRASATVQAALAVPIAERYRIGVRKNVLCGVTLTMHHDPWHASLDAPELARHVLPHYGWCHSLGLGGADMYGPQPQPSYRATPACTGWFIHLAEGTDDVAHQELRQLAALGCLRSNTVLVHGVGLTASDVELIIAQRASVVWCPSSNLRMLGQTIPRQHLRRLFNAGLLGIGTDSCLTGAPDLLAELRIAAQHSDFSPLDLFELATTRNSAVLRAQAGGLAVGQRADFVVLRGCVEREAILAMPRAAIRAVVCAGQPVWADEDFADWFAACAIATTKINVDGATKLGDARLWPQLPLPPVS